MFFISLGTYGNIFRFHWFSVVSKTKEFVINRPSSYARLIMFVVRNSAADEILRNQVRIFFSVVYGCWCNLLLYDRKCIRRFIFLLFISTCLITWQDLLSSLSDLIVIHTNKVLLRNSLINIKTSPMTIKCYVNRFITMKSHRQDS